MTENELQQIMPFTCTNSNCANRKACRIKNGELVTTPELNVRLKATTLDERVEFFPIKECDSIDEAIINSQVSYHHSQLAAYGTLYQRQKDCNDIWIRF